MTPLNRLSPFMIGAAVMRRHSGLDRAQELARRSAPPSMRSVFKWRVPKLRAGDALHGCRRVRSGLSVGIVSKLWAKIASGMDRQVVFLSPGCGLVSNHRVERTATRRLVFDIVGFMSVIGQSVSAWSVAVAHSGRSANESEKPL